MRGESQQVSRQVWVPARCAYLVEHLNNLVINDQKDTVHRANTTVSTRPHGCSMSDTHGGECVGGPV